MNWCIRYCFHGFLAPNRTITVHFFANLCCFFFMFKRISWHAGKILADVLPTCRLAGWDEIFWQNVRPTFLTFCQHDGPCQDGMSFGGSWWHDTTTKFPSKQLNSFSSWIPVSSKQLSSCHLLSKWNYIFIWYLKREPIDPTGPRSG